MRATLALVVLASACASAPPASWAGAPLAEGVTPVDAERARAPRHLVDGWPARRADGAVLAVIEVPAGTNAKVEVDHEAGDLRWERRDGRPRVIDFLGYPGSYGFVPSTLLPSDEGGDGDPIDVVVIGAPLPRGAVVAVRPVAVLRLLDEGERDDKVIAVLADAAPNDPFAAVRDLSDLERDYPSALRILELWFASYDRAQTLVVEGWGDAALAERLIDAAARR